MTERSQSDNLVKNAGIIRYMSPENLGKVPEHLFYSLFPVSG